VYLTGGPVAEREAEVVWVDRAGRATPVEAGWTMTPDLGSGPALSPDGSRFAVSIVGTDGRHVWIKPTRGGTLLRLTFDGQINVRPRWTPDGQSVTFLTDRASSTLDAHVKRADGSGAAQPVLSMDEGVVEAFWSSDSQWLVARTQGQSVLALRAGADSAPRVLLPSPPAHVAPRLSPDGRWLAYTSNESGVPQVYVKPFPNVDDGRWLISTTGGGEPVWARSGRELFYRTAEGDLIAVAVTTRPTFTIGERTTLFRQPPWLTLQATGTYDVSPDGERFLMLRPVGAQDASGRQLIVVENWLEDIRAKATAR
jgi:serine/threonine-protein kinase